MNRSTIVLLMALVTGFATTPVLAQQAYPNKTIRILTGNPGGGNDIVSRLLAKEIAGPLGQTVVVENRTSILATDGVAKAVPDGYTLLVTGESLWLTPILRPDTPYDPVRDLAPISLLSRQVNIIAVNPGVPAKSVKEFIALAKSKPGELNYAYSGVGGNSFLSAELFKTMAGINIVAVGYKGNAATAAAVMGGQVQMLITDPSVLAPHIAAGKMRALAVTSAEPSTLAPGLPTVTATGLPGYETIAVTGIWAPARTPDAVIHRLSQELVRMLARPDVKAEFFKTGSEVVGNSPEQFASHIKTEMTKWTKLIKDSNIKIE